MKNYADAKRAMLALAPDARWSSSFGNPGDFGFCEYWRTPDHTRWIISSGTWCEYRWSVTALYDRAPNEHVLAWMQHDLDTRYGPCIDSLAEMLAAMRWAESGVHYFSV